VDDPVDDCCAQQLKEFDGTTSGATSSPCTAKFDFTAKASQ